MFCRLAEFRGDYPEGIVLNTPQYNVCHFWPNGIGHLNPSAISFGPMPKIKMISQLFAPRGGLDLNRMPLLCK